MPKPKHPTPAVQVNIFLVGHGYQIDVVDYTGKEPLMDTHCRDFAGSYKVPEIAAAIAQELPKAMQRLERLYLAPVVRIVRQKGKDQSGAISEARTLLSLHPNDKVELHVKPCDMREQEAINNLLLAAAGIEERYAIRYDVK